jgi:chemotaxis protein CheC
VPPLLPSPPTFRHEFAGSLLEFAVMDQAMTLDRLLLVESRFTTEHGEMDWSLLLVPSCESLQVLSAALEDIDGTRGAS